MSTQTFDVLGMTCEHCAHAVTEELSAIEGVTAVDVALHAGGTSHVTVTSTAGLSPEQVGAALDEAGDYRLAS